MSRSALSPVVDPAVLAAQVGRVDRAVVHRVLVEPCLGCPSRSHQRDIFRRIHVHHRRGRADRVVVAAEDSVVLEVAGTRVRW